MRSRNRRSRPGVFQLNSGATSFGRPSVLPLNAPGGSFMSGRSAGGGPGAADTIARALAQGGPQQSVQGSLSDIGPPPVDPFLNRPVGTPPTSRPQDAVVTPTFRSPFVAPSLSTLFGIKSKPPSPSLPRLF